MKWLGRIATSLVILGLSTLMLAILQPWIAEISENNRIEAKVELSRWAQRPTKSEIIDISKKESVDKDLFRSAFADDSGFQTAFFKLSNNTSNEISNVRIRFPDQFKRDAFLLIDNGLVKKSFVDITDLKLPNMLPGDHMKLYLWSDAGFRTLIFNEDVKTFSSAGPFNVEISTPRRVDFPGDEKNGFLKFMDEWIGWITATLAITLIIVLFFMIYYYDKYIRETLESYDMYDSEASRYKEDPKKFTPKLA